MVILYGAMSQRGPEKAISLIIMMDYMKQFQGMVNSLASMKDN